MAQPNRVLVVDDEASFRDILACVLSDEGYDVAQADTAEKGLAIADTFAPDVVVMDQKLPGISGQEAMERLLERVPGVKVIMVTAFGAIDLAVEAMQRGAYDYLTKPFDNDELLLRVARAIETRQMALEVAHLHEALEGEYSFGRILGQSEALQDVLRMACKAAQSDVPVLVEGESGTGKELLVRAIHHAGQRSRNSFVAVNCAAVPADLVESAFFGHVKGAFTGAVHDHAGKFEQADGGTLFLDEITEMSGDLQAKLLRALEEQEISRVGSTAPVPVNVRVISATNRIVQEAVREGVLREDLYHRLAVISVRMPALRERRADIPLLARSLLGKFHQETGISPTDFSDGALACLTAFDWPGNVRELQNAVQHAAIMAEGERVRACDLPEAVRSVGEKQASCFEAVAPSEEGETLADAVTAVEKVRIARALAEVGDNRTHAAARLGISRKTLLAKIAQYGL